MTMPTHPRAPFQTLLAILAAAAISPTTWPAASPSDTPQATEPVAEQEAAAEPEPAIDQTATEPEAAAGESEDDLSDLSLEQLLQIEVVEVTSVSGVAESAHQVPAAISVITAEDIRRGGHRTIADALRMVPGMHVQQAGSSIWAVSSRGFTGRYTDKLLVMIDGRTVYSPLFSGTYWDVQDVVLEDIDRIEVIRGPGATLWGANAVNGVINVVTRSAKETQGVLLTGGGGTEERGFGTIRYGGKAGEKAWYRVYGKFSDRDGLRTPGDEDAGDSWNIGQGGMRFDIEGEPGVNFMFEAEAYTARENEPAQLRSLAAPFISNTLIDTRASGGHVLGRITNDSPEGDGWSLQGYADRTMRRQGDLFDSTLDTFDLDFRHHFAIGDRNEFIYGVGFRHWINETEGSAQTSFDPADRSASLFTAFVQDTFQIVPDHLALMVGSKFEHNDFTGFELQPSARLAWTPNEQHTVWGSVSRAIRTPSRINDDIRAIYAVIPPPPIALPITATGSTKAKSENLLAYELGYRWVPARSLAIDLATFYNDYDDLVEFGSDPFNPLNVIAANERTAESYGVETAATWSPCDNWRLMATYSFLRLVEHEGEGDAEGQSAQNLFSLRSYLDITKDVELNAAAYFTDNLPNFGIHSAWRLDVGVTWRPHPNVELAIWLQNLLDDRRPEHFDSALIGYQLETERSVYAQCTIRF
jgi:iron complex outermembrane recepter protein